MSISVYIACSLRWKRAASEWAAALERSGIEIASTWHGDPAVAEDPSDDDSRRIAIRRITADLQAADVLVVLAHLGEPRATFVESGLALGMGKPVVWVHLGDVGRQIFDAHPRTLRLDISAPGLRPHVAALHDSVRKAVSL